MRKSRPALFQGRHFQEHVIVLCVRWYLRYCLTLRDLEELMMERGLSVDHSTIGRWVLRYAPELNKRIRREIQTPNRSWRVDEAYVRVGGVWTYLYRAVSIPIMVQDAPLLTRVAMPAALLARMGREIERVLYVKVEVPPTAPKVSAVLN